MPSIQKKSIHLVLYVLVFWPTYSVGLVVDAAELTPDGGILESAHSWVRREEHGSKSVLAPDDIAAFHQGDAVEMLYRKGAPHELALNEQWPGVPQLAVPNFGLNLTNLSGQNSSQNVTNYVEVTRDQQEVAAYIGLMLLGSVTFIMSLFYGTNFPDPDVSYATWKALSQTACIFSAVFIFQSFKDVMVYQFGEFAPDSTSLPDLKSMIIAFGRFYLLYLLVQFFLMKYRRDPMRLKAWGMIGGMAVAFSAIDAFGMLQQFEPFRNNPAQCFLAWLIAAFMMGCMAVSSGIVRNWIMTYEDGVIKEHELAWDEQCKETENTGLGITLGFLLSVMIRYAISGTLPPVEGSPRNKSQGEVDILLGVSLGLALPVLAIAGTLYTLKKQAKTLGIIVRTLTITLEVVVMTMGWCCTFEGQWIFWSATNGAGVGLGDKMSARMVCALAQSYIGFVLIIGIDFVADKIKVGRAAFDAVVRAIILGIALAWQGAFRRAVQGISRQSNDAGVRAYTDVALSIFLCGIVVPAWALYILPRDLYGPLPKPKTVGEAGKNGAETAPQSGETPNSGEAGAEQEDTNNEVAATDENEATEDNGDNGDNGGLDAPLLSKGKGGGGKGAV